MQSWRLTPKSKSKNISPRRGLRKILAIIFLILRSIQHLVVFPNTCLPVFGKRELYGASPILSRVYPSYPVSFQFILYTKHSQFEFCISSIYSVFFSAPRNLIPTEHPRFASNVGTVIYIVFLNFVQLHSYGLLQFNFCVLHFIFRTF